MERMDKDEVSGEDCFHLRCVNITIVPDEKWTFSKCEAKNFQFYKRVYYSLGQQYTCSVLFMFTEVASEK